ncbi:hypothetical protein [Enhygromyxa salina]|uniref:Uncharacterized protein n=1 Tax=Enhygromyxa salina TaxID=215803 RepID=A0A2S9YY23_9BACT|nr:hypothetical protein [Enhygromyxa salina]PRQ09959.1 hypothetical protein ENSA7_03160 [Enhygromyxa salina]
MKTAPNYISYQGYATLYGFEYDGSGRDMVDTLRKVGMTLASPGSGKVVVLDDTCEERRDISAADFQRMVRSTASLWFKVWTAKGSDLLCNVQRHGGWWCEYYVIGYLQADAAPLVEKLVQRFVAASHRHQEQFLIVDWQNRAEEVDWNDIWEKTATYDGEALEVMGIPSRLESQFNGVFEGTSETHLTNHRLLTTSSSRLSD